MAGRAATSEGKWVLDLEKLSRNPDTHTHTQLVFMPDKKIELPLVAGHV